MVDLPICQRATRSSVQSILAPEVIECMHISELVWMSMTSMCRYLCSLSSVLVALVEPGNASADAVILDNLQDLPSVLAAFGLR